MKLIWYEISERFACRETRYFIKVIMRVKYAAPADAIRGVVTVPASGVGNMGKRFFRDV